MQLKEFSLISLVIESGTVLKALETAIPKEAISQAIADTHSHEERRRALPSHLV
ncbi:transposase domain-containing protein, partial [Nostoc sp. CHAB 5715]|nr:transposase domain-containing protein [Nostoc sp. CHAB 5715]